MEESTHTTLRQTHCGECDDTSRPKRLSDIAHQTEAVATLQGCLDTGELPHLLFYGPPGTGKTSAILALAHELWGPLVSERVLELNASDERGIAAVRNRVKTFAKVAVAKSSSAEGFPCPPIKLIILDEADSLTPDAQSALRRTMELYSKYTRFCLIGNYVSRIIDPITSRCAKFRFKPLPDAVLLARMEAIAEEEAIDVAPDVLAAIISVAGGDMRQAVTLLQSGVRLYGSDLSPDSILYISGALPASRLDALLDVIRSNKFDDLKDAVSDLALDGYAADKLVSALSDWVVSTSEIDDMQKALIMRRLAIADKALQDGADERLQMIDFTSHIMRVVAQLPLDLGWRDSL